MNANVEQFSAAGRVQSAPTGGLLSRFEIRTRLQANAFAFAGTLALVAGLTWYGREESAAGLTEMGDAVAIQRTQMEIDMLHDGIRGDVEHTLLAPADEIAAARVELSGHLRRLDELTAQLDKVSDKDVAAQLSASRGPLANYAAMATTIVDLAGRDHDAALAKLPEFEAAFSSLEVSLSALGDAVQADAATHAEASATSVTHAAELTIVVAMLTGVIGSIMSVVVASGITRSLRTTVDALDSFAQGDCTTRVEVVGNDEVARMSRALNDCVGNTAETIRAVVDGASTLSSSAGALTRTAEAMSGELGTMGSQLQNTSSGADQVSASVQAVATGMDAMSAAMHEIARNAVQAARVAASAVSAADGTSQAIARLGESGGEIGKFVKVISTIAHQTNLLALNATIEAARAGEAGRGFAVVANEVKDLARETARATEDISRKIEAIQADTRKAVDSNDQISGVIAQINDLQTAIAGAVEEQTATTKEIARNLQDAAQASAAVATGISEMARSAQTATVGASEFEGSTGHLSRLAVELETNCARFRL